MYNYGFKVCVRCYTYNHSKYIREALDGFTMQQTSFPFVCIIVDDASTDGEPEVLSQYLEENFDLNDTLIVRQENSDDYMMTFARHRKNVNCYFAVYLLKNNHYSIRKPKYQYYEDFFRGIKYLAICEGDDYWIDPMKLQTQVDYMEKHPDCTMTCSRAKRFSEKKGKYISEQYCRKSDGILSPVDIINRTGLYIPTCSIVYRPWLKDNYPDYCHNCKVGDYPLQITAAMKGNVYYFNRSMCVYRIDNSSSWIGKQKKESIDPERLKVVNGQKEMFEGFAKDYPKYRLIFQNKIFEHILKNMPKSHTFNADELQIYEDYFSEVFSNLPLKWKFYSMICKSRITIILKWYKKVFLLKYRPKVMVYKN